MQVTWSCVKNEYSIKIYFEERNKLPSKKMKIKIINNQAKTSLVLAWFFSRLIIIHAEISKVWIWLSTCILPRWQYAWILPGWMKNLVTYFLSGTNEAWIAAIVAVKQHCRLPMPPLYLSDSADHFDWHDCNKVFKVCLSILQMLVSQVTHSLGWKVHNMNANVKWLVKKLTSMYHTKENYAENR